MSTERLIREKGGGGRGLGGGGRGMEVREEETGRLHTVATLSPPE